MSEQAKARKIERQLWMRGFVAAHDLSCFSCNADDAEWAKTGISPRHGPWAICVPCVKQKK